MPVLRHFNLSVDEMPYKRYNIQMECMDSIASAMEEAKKPDSTRKTIAFNISGHGFMDMGGHSEVLGL